MRRMVSIAANGTTGAALLAIALASGAAAAQEVNLYSSRHYDTDVALYDAFTEQTGIEVNLIEGKRRRADRADQGRGREQPGRRADHGRRRAAVARRGGRAPAAGRPRPVLEERIPANLRHPEGKWFGLSQRLRGVVYAKDRVDPSRDHELRGSRRSEVAGPDLHPLVDQRLQPVAGRLDDRGGGHRGDRGLGARAGRQPGAPAPGRRYRPDQGGGGRRVRRRRGQPLLLRPAARVRQRRRSARSPSRSASCSPTRTGAGRMPTSAAPA